MLLDAGERRAIAAGGVVHASKGHVHGADNTGTERFNDLTVTCPPEKMTALCETRQDGRAGDRDG